MVNETRFENSTGANTAGDMDPDALDRVDATLIAADRVAGTAVYNAEGDKLGSIDSIQIDKRTGKVAYVVMSFGGFLGIGERYHPLPWHVLTYDIDVGGYRVALDRSALEGAPSYGREEVDSFDYDRNRAGIDSYYAPAADAPAGGPVSAANRSDANDGIDRPLGYYSSQAQADRDNNVEGRASTTNEAAGGPGFYSPEQQAVRNSSAETILVHADGPDLVPSNTDNQKVPATEHPELAGNGDQARRVI